MHSRPRFILALVILLGITTVGATGFVLIEGLGWLDAFYLSVVTMSTVGFGDITPETRAGQLFTMALVITGVGSALYLISVIAQDILEGRLRDFFHRSSMMRDIKKHTGHVIVCGYGRYGRVVAAELERAHRTVVVIENDVTRESDLTKQDVDYVIGSAAEDEALLAAGIDRADAIVVGTSDDATSVFITLSARELNPKIRIHARGESDKATRRLKSAGADVVDSPYQMGGIRAAASILHPSVVDFLDLSRANSQTEIDLEEIRVADACQLVGATVGDVEGRHAQLRVVGLRRQDQSFELVPKAAGRIAAGDHLVVIGEREAVVSLARAAVGEN